MARVFVPEVAVHAHRHCKRIVVHAAVFGKLLRAQPLFEVVHEDDHFVSGFELNRKVGADHSSVAVSRSCW